MAKSQSSFLRGDEVGAAPGWDFGLIGQASPRFAAKLKAQAMAEGKSGNDLQREAGYSDGFTNGYAQGHAQATLEGQRQINAYIATQGKEAAEHFDALFAAAQAHLREQEQTMASGVLDLACELARQVLRHELSSNPNALLPVVREALGLLVADSKAVLVRMHPLDADIFSSALGPELPGASISVVADALLARGGCLVESAGTVVDATVEKRWMRTVARLGLDFAWEVPDEPA